jgi:hypothetical protein
VTERLDPIDATRPAPAAPVRPVVLTPAEREAERRRRERARAARRAPADGAPKRRGAPAGRLDVRG